MENQALGHNEGLLGARGNPGGLVVSTAPQDMCGLYFSGISQKNGVAGGSSPLLWRKQNEVGS